MTTSLPACYHLVYLRKKPRDDDKLPGSLSSSAPKEKSAENDNEPRNLSSSSVIEAK
jgi:hypothetical protein